jgi:hypothetical protein
MVVLFYVMSVVCVLGGVLLIVVAARFSRRQVARSEIVGVRTRATLQTEDGWFEAHVAVAPLFRAHGLWFVAGGALCAVLTLARVSEVLAVVPVAAAVLASAVYSVASIQRGSKVARAHNESTGLPRA